MKIIDLGIFGRPISMGSPIVFFGLPVAAFVSSLILSCGQRIPAHSTVTTVDIPQTPVRNQQKTGFCWAYATAGMVEAWSLKSGKALNVSEEAIAFYRVAEELLYVSKDSVLRQKIIDAPTMTDSLMDEVFVEGLQGGEVLYTDSLPSKQRTLSGLEILEKYGAWPETAWPTKIGNSRPVISGIAERFKSLLAANPSSEPCCTMKDLIEKVMIAPEGSPDSGFAGSPPSSFDFDGSTTNSKLFWTSLNFDVSKYEAVTIKHGASSFNGSIQRVKQALASGLSVPIEFPVVSGHLDKTASRFKVVDGLPFNVSGFSGHVVLITDWVNQGGRPGAVSPEEFDASLNANPDQFDYFVVKNSWGEGPFSLQAQNQIPAGHFTMYRDYLEQSAASSAVVTQPGYLFVVLPKVGF